MKSRVHGSGRFISSVATDLSRGLTVRLGGVFLGLIVLALVLSRFDIAGVSEGEAAWPWMVVVVAIACGGLVNLRACRVAGQIQTELLQSDGDPRRWREVRPMVGTGPIVDSWNTLIEQAGSQAIGVEPTEPVRSNDTQNALMARAMRSVSAGIAVTNRQFEILAVNAPFAALFGLAGNAKLRDRNLIELLCEVASSDTSNQLSSASADGSVSKVFQDDIRRLSGGGNAVTVRLTCALPEDGDTEGVSDAQNVTGSEALGRVLRVNRTRLAGRDGDVDGYAWLLQDVTQQVMASAARDQFLQTATHELRTPLANLRAYAEALSIESGVSVEEQKEFCNIISDETNRLSRLIDHLLTVGQLEAGSLVIQQHSLDPIRIIEEAIDYAKPQISAANLTLQTDISPKLRKIIGDKDKLHAVLVNLIGNAAKYTPSGGSVRVAARLKNDAIEVSIEDNGIGIDADDLHKIFDKFYRVESDYVHQQAGNGLGLAFAREVARLHHGDITVESRLGEGSVFTLRLPAPDEPAVK